MPNERSLLDQVVDLVDQAIATTDPMEGARLIEQASRLHRIATTIAEAKAGLQTAPTWLSRSGPA